MIKRIASRVPRVRVPIKQVARTLHLCKPLFFALGDGTRQQIILLLENVDECNVTELADKLPLSRPATEYDSSSRNPPGRGTILSGVIAAHPRKPSA